MTDGVAAMLFSTVIGTILVIVLILLIALWIALPFAVFGTKPLLRQLIDEAKRTNARLTSMEGYVRYMAEVTKELEDAKRNSGPSMNMGTQ